MAGILRTRNFGLPAASRPGPGPAPRGWGKEDDNPIQRVVVHPATHLRPGHGLLRASAGNPSPSGGDLQYGSRRSPHHVCRHLSQVLLINRLPGAVGGKIQPEAVHRRQIRWMKTRLAYGASGRKGVQSWQPVAGSGLCKFLAASCCSRADRQIDHN